MSSRGAADRVRRSHAQTRVTMRCALAFIAAAVLVAAFAVVRDWDSARWLPLHLFLAGGVVLAISGVSLMLTVTWSAAPAPPDRWVALQRGCIVVGATGIAVAWTADAPAAVTAVAGAIHLAGLLLLGLLLATTVRAGEVRRFDVAVAAYLAALVAGAVGVSLGLAMVFDSPRPPLRDAHLSANLLGLVGLVIGGTMPFFAATVGRAKMSKAATPARLGLTLAWQVVSLALVVAMLLAERHAGAAVGFVAYAAGVLAVLTVLPRPTRRQWEWSGPRLVALWAGALWWAAAVGATAVDASAGRAVLVGRWLLVLVVAGYAQILWGSLAYLLPMLRGGGHERLGEGFATTRSWPGLVCAQVAGLALVAEWGRLALVAVALWVLDAAWRAARVGTSRAARPDEQPRPEAPPHSDERGGPAESGT